MQKIIKLTKSGAYLGRFDKKAAENQKLRRAADNPVILTNTTFSGGFFGEYSKIRQNAAQNMNKLLFFHKLEKNY